MIAFHKLCNQGLIDLFFVDETGFKLSPSNSYAWQPIGEQWGIPAIKKKVLNVLGFLNPKTNALITYPLPKNAYMNSELFIKYVNDFSDKITKETVIFIDRAPWHTSKQTLDRIEHWEKKGLYIAFVPPYSPHLNLIETLWRKIKYEWLKKKDYRSITSLKNRLKDIFSNYGKDFIIEFSMNIFSENISV